MYDLDTKEGMANAIKWTQQLFDVLNDKSTWGVPRSGTTVQIDKATKTATITYNFTPDPSIAQVIEAMGWTVITKGESK